MLCTSTAVVVNVLSKDRKKGVFIGRVLSLSLHGDASSALSCIGLSE